MPEYGSDATGGASYRNSAGALSIALDRVYNEALLPESVNFRYFLVVMLKVWQKVMSFVSASNIRILDMV
jgi:hypothetical protein